MSSRTRWGVLLAFAALLGAGLAGYSVQSRCEYHSAAFTSMGTAACVSLHTGRENFSNALKAVMAEFRLVTEIADLHSEKSELSRLNRSAAAAPFVCSPELWEILTESRRAYKLSGGAFDISVKPLMTLWGFYRKRSQVPDAAEIAKVRELTGLDKVIFDDKKHTVKFSRPGMALDLGGIAKGYALERAARALIRMGITRGVIDLGGNLRLLPELPPGRVAYRIGIRRPMRKNGGVIPEILQLQGNLAVSSSGYYERYVKLGGKYYGHIIDPVTGIPAPRDYAATAIAPDAACSDWLSTAVFLRGETMAARLKRMLPGTDFIIVKKDGE